MFGLLRYQNSLSDLEQRRLHRSYYCGVCKTIGLLFSNKIRFLLSSDAVFLAKLLSAISNNNEIKLDFSYKNYNCFQLPKLRNQIPLSIQYAATVNVILTKIKLLDYKLDSNNFGGKIINRIFSKDFEKADCILKQWNYPIRDLQLWFKIQNNRENEIKSKKKITNHIEMLEYLCEPTAIMTAITFQKGAEVIKEKFHYDILYQLGFNFGKLIYITDALEDFPLDVKKNSFNALKSIYHISDSKIPKFIKQQVIYEIKKIQYNICDIIGELPISKIKIKTFINAINQNVSNKVNEQTILTNCKWSINQRFNFAKQAAKKNSIEKSASLSSAAFNFFSLSILYSLFAFFHPNKLPTADLILAGYDCKDITTPIINIFCILLCCGYPMCSCCISGDCFDCCDCCCQE